MPVYALQSFGSVHSGPCKVSVHQKTAVYPFPWLKCMCRILWMSESCAHAQTTDCMSTLKNTILCTTEVHVHAQNALKCMSLLSLILRAPRRGEGPGDEASPCLEMPVHELPRSVSMHSGLCKVSLDWFAVIHVHLQKTVQCNPMLGNTSFCKTMCCAHVQRIF